MKRWNSIIPFLLTAAVSLFCVGCAQNVKLKIQDLGSARSFETRSGMTVEEVLNQANYPLGKRDKCKPGRDTKITAETKKIVIQRYAKVTLVDLDGKAQAVSLVGGTVQDALDAAGVKLTKRQYVEPEKKTYLQNGMEIHIRKKHTVTVVVDGKRKTVTTRAKTVQELLEKQEIELKRNDTVSPNQSKKITDKVTTVRVRRVKYKKIEQTESIPYETKKKYSSGMKKGKSRISRKGVNGKKKVTYRVKYVDGKKSKRKIIQQCVIRNPVDEVIIYGTKEA